MFHDPPDDNAVFCQTCGEWTHPRSECARDSSHETAPLPVMKLRRKGPLPGDEFGGTTYESKKKHGIAKFDLQAHTKGTQSTFGSTHAVYYLSHEHPPTQVLTEWLQVNKGVLEGRELTTENITRALSKRDFKEAWRELRSKEDFDVLDDADHSDRGGDYQEVRECPYCGEDVERLPTHLPSCPENPE